MISPERLRSRLPVGSSATRVFHQWRVRARVKGAALKGWPEGSTSSCQNSGNRFPCRIPGKSWQKDLILGAPSIEGQSRSGRRYSPFGSPFPSERTLYIVFMGDSPSSIRPSRAWG